MARKNKSKSKIVVAAEIAGKILYWMIFTGLIVIAGTIAISNFNLPNGFKVFTVVSGSMEPQIHTGSIVFIQNEAAYKIGDIITFVPQTSKRGDTVTHRIYAIKNKNGETLFETKGDANKVPDTELVPSSSVLGKEIFAIPFLGFPIAYAKTQQGLIFLIVLPAAMIIYSELVSIKNEALKLLKERKKKLTLAQKVEMEIGLEEIKTEHWYQRFLRHSK